jgi:hypothetical protein
VEVLFAWLIELDVEVVALLVLVPEARDVVVMVGDRLWLVEVPLDRLTLREGLLLTFVGTLLVDVADLVTDAVELLGLETVVDWVDF